MKILVIQTSRFGDLLQTTPMLHVLRRRYPDASITVLSRYNVMEIYKDNPDVDFVELFNIEEYTNRLLNNPGDLFNFYTELRDAVNRLNAMKFDLVINITHDRFSTFLTYLVSSDEIKGMYLSSNNRLQILINGFWFLYLRCTSEFREAASFNLADIYKNTVGGDRDTRHLFFNPDPDSKKTAENLLKQHRYHNKQEHLIGFQLGTSNGRRRWPSKYFAELGNLLHKDQGTKVVLVGSKGEKKLGDEVASHMEEEPINLIGKTDIPTLARVMGILSLLVTNDTGTMHLAEAVGTRCVALFFESANPFQTGPYGSGHVICSADLECFPCPTTFQCDEKICLNLIPAETVYRLIKYSLKKGSVPTVTDTEGLRIYETRFSETGVWDAWPLNRIRLDKKDLIRRVYRNMWLRYANDTGVIDFQNGGALQSILDEETKQWSGAYSPEKQSIQNCIDDFNTNLDTLDKKIDKGLELFEEIISKGKKVPLDTAGITRNADDLGIIEKDISRLGRSNLCVSQLTNLFALELEQIQDSDFFKMQKDWKTVYDQMRSRMDILIDEIKVMEEVIEHHYPKQYGGKNNCTM